MRILIRTSKWAIWSRRFGALALPLAALPVWLHRERFLTSEQFEIIEAVALFLAAIALIVGLIAIARLWMTGDQGWGRATQAVVFGALCLAPAAYLAFEAIRLPATPDVSTDFGNPPQLLSFIPARFIGPDERKRIETAFPNARARTYPVAVTALYPLVEQLVVNNGWDIRSRRVPLNVLGTGDLNAVATTLFGWRQEIALRVKGTTDGAIVDMRSASLTDFHDFAENGHRIERFMLDLDNAVTLYLRDAPAAPVSDEN